MTSMTRRATAVALGLILLVALAARLDGVGFGLPALYDPDEPIFVLAGLKLISHHTLNPGWFGHPGSTTIYMLALIEIGTYAVGHWLGDFAGTSDFVAAIYRDPGTIWLPARLFFVLCGVGCVALTFVVAQRVAGRRAALLAAALLAINALHVTWSQVIRTDVQASVFMLASLVFASRIARTGRPLDYLGAAAMAGFACATKWPAATVIFATVAAAMLRAHAAPDDARRQLARLAAAGAAMVGATLLASPYLVLDFATVVSNLTGEASPHHLGATGGSFGHNLLWYFKEPLRGAFGIAGLAAGAAGLVVAVRRAPIVLAVVVAPLAVFLIAICSQRLIWARWIVPALPLLSILAAIGLDHAITMLQRHYGRRVAAFAGVGLGLVVAGPMVAAAHAATTERAHDTRTLAAAWIVAHVPRDRTVAVEHFAFQLIAAGYPVLFPVGEAGCRDARTMLTGKISYAQVGKLRGRTTLADFGTIEPTRLASCRAPVVMTVDYDRYRAEAADYPVELAAYATILAGAREVAVFRPVAKRIGGPVTRVWFVDPAGVAKPSAIG